MSRRAVLLPGAVAILSSGFQAAALAQTREADLFIRPSDQRSLLFGGVESGRSVFASAGSKQALTGPLDATGWLAFESSGFGLTRERTRFDGLDRPATRFTTQSSVLTGHQWNLPGLFATLLVGPDLQHEQLTVDGRVLRFSKPRYGGRAQVELWSNPTPETLLTGTAVASTIRGSVWARAAAGLRVADALYAGPEISTYATSTYREVRFGGHLTGWRAGLLQGRLSAGWMTSDDRKPGAPYLGASAWLRL